MVESNRDWFLAGWFCDSAEPFVPVDEPDADCFFVWFLSGNLKACAIHHDHTVPFLAWQRHVRGDERVKIRPYPQLI